MKRIAKGALAAALLTGGLVQAQAAAEAPPPTEAQRTQSERRTPPPLPVVTPLQIGIEPPVNPEMAYGKSEDPPLAADPIPVRKNFAPEIAEVTDTQGL